MDLSELLEGLGRCVAYPPKLARILGVKECVLVTQLLYWHGKQADSEGWIYKTQQEIEDETGLSECEQLTARKRLKALQILEEKLSRLDHKMFYRVNRATLNKVWSDSRISGSTIRGAGNQRFGNLRISDSSISESTSEITTQSTGTNGVDVLALNSEESSIPKKFTKPTIEEFKSYGASISLPPLQCDACFDYYQSNGWRVGKNPMKDWRGAMRNWKRNWEARGGQCQTGGANGSAFNQGPRNESQGPSWKGMSDAEIVAAARG